MLLEASVIILWLIVIAFIILVVIAYTQHTLSGPTGPQGQQGIPGTAVNTGPTGPPSSLTETSAYFYINGSGNSNVQINGGQDFIYKIAVLPPNNQIKYNTRTGQITVLQTGRYFISWGYNQNGFDGSTVTALTVNNVSFYPAYSAISIDGFSTQPAFTGIIVLTANDVLTLRNVISTNTPIILTSGGLTPITQIAYLTIVRVF